MSNGLPGWEDLRHGGLLLDAARLEALSRDLPAPLDDYTEQQLRRRGDAILDGSGELSPFVAFVLERLCGFGGTKGTWGRGSNVSTAWSRRAVTGQMVRLRHLWQGRHGATLPVFLDDGKQLGRGRSRPVVSQALGWLRAGSQRLALLTRPSPSGPSSTASTKCAGPETNARSARMPGTPKPWKRYASRAKCSRHLSGALNSKAKRSGSRAKRSRS